MTGRAIRFAAVLWRRGWVDMRVGRVRGERVSPTSLGKKYGQQGLQIELRVEQAQIWQLPTNVRDVRG